MQQIDFETAFRKVIALEGGLTLHQNQTESAQTYAGIYRAAHPSWPGWAHIDRGSTPPVELVRDFYRRQYWDSIPISDSPARFLIFEYGVNAGLTKAVKVAQAVLGLVPDGIIGPNTASALENAPDSFPAAYTLARIAHYADLANRDPKRYGIYLRGWVNRALKGVTIWDS